MAMKPYYIKGLVLYNILSPKYITSFPFDVIIKDQRLFFPSVVLDIDGSIGGSVWF